jgi:hypothetical protein
LLCRLSLTYPSRLTRTKNTVQKSNLILMSKRMLRTPTPKSHLNESPSFPRTSRLMKDTANYYNDTETYAHKMNVCIHPTPKPQPYPPNSPTKQRNPSQPARPNQVTSSISSSTSTNASPPNPASSPSPASNHYSTPSQSPPRPMNSTTMPITATPPRRPPRRK